MAAAPMSKAEDHANQIRDVAFIDADVENADLLVSHLQPGIKAVSLNRGTDPVGQILGILGAVQGLETIRVISHAEPGALSLAGTRLDAPYLRAHAEDMSAIGRALKSGGQVLLYGCDLAAGAKGDEFLHEFARLTGATVAASTNKTGAASLGGDWLLEAHTGTAASQPKPMFTEGFEYSALLPAPFTNVDPGNNPVFARPGGISNTWTFGPTNNGTQPIVTLDYLSNGTSALTRGKFQYSTNGGSSWTDLPYNDTNYLNWLSVSGKTYRYVDSQPGDTTTSNNFFVEFTLPNGSISSTSQIVFPDNPPTDVLPRATDFWGTPSPGDLVAGLINVDTGNTLGGVYAIDSQGTANLFTVSGTSLALGSGTLPAVGQGATVTLRYYDFLQTDNSGVPIAGQGVTRTVTMTRRANPSGFSTEVEANTTTANNQNAPQVAGLSDGSYVVVWRSVGQDGESTSFGGIYARKFTSAGVPNGGEFAISPAGNGINEQNPSVAALNAGRFVVAYTQLNADNDVIYRVVEANGTLGAQTSAASTTTGAQTVPSVTALSDGNFAITWIGVNGADSGDVWVRKFNSSDGSPVVGSELVVNTTTSGAQSLTNISGLSNGNYAVAWRDPANNGDVKARVMGPTAAVSAEIAVAGGANSQSNPRVAGLTGGGFVVVNNEASRTESGVADTSSQGNVYFRRYDNTGVLQGSETLVHGAVQGNQVSSGICALSGGGFVVAFASDIDPDGTLGVFGRRFDATGAAVDSYEFQLNQRRTGIQSTPVVAPLASNGFAAAWNDSTLDSSSDAGVGTRAFTGAGASAPTVTGVSSTTADGAYKAGSSVSITVTFSASVTVTGAPTLALNSGGTATYASGSPGTTLTFSYTVGATQNSADLDYSATTSLALAGGTINATSGGTAATLTLPAPGAAGSLGNNKAIVIDTTRPTVSSITRKTPTGQTTGSTSVTFHVVFSEAVQTVTSANFSVQGINGGTVTGTIGTVSGSGTTWDVPVTITGGAGEFKLVVN